MLLVIQFGGEDEQLVDCNRLEVEFDRNILTFFLEGEARGKIQRTFEDIDFPSNELKLTIKKQ